jgi:GH3 auxin-responsive promoter
MRLFKLLFLGLGKIVARPIRRHLAAFQAATHDPQKTQDALLKRILTHQAGTDFGRRHRFHEVRSLADFRNQIPVAGYDYYDPYIARVRKGDLNALLADRRVHMFALTSGTTAARKYIPVTDQYLADYKRGWNIWGLRAMRDHKNVRLRPIVQLSGDHEEFHTEASIPCGAVTGLTAAMQKRIVHWLYCVPGCVGKIKDAHAKYYLTLRLSLPKKVGMVISANPSTLVQLARAGDAEKESLLRDLRDGTLADHLDIPADVRSLLAGRLRKKHPQRVRELEEIINRTGTFYPKDYWPAKDLLLGNWTGGSVGAYLRHYPRYFGEAIIRDIGLIASEGRMTIPLADDSPAGVLDVTTHFFEFIPQDEIDSAKPTILLAHELKEGESYFILPTTAFGLYRYNIHDVVRVTGFHNRTPLIEFLNKGAYFSNLTGEKLSEYHVTKAMSAVLRVLNGSLTAYSLAPCWDDEVPYYGLFVERTDLTGPEQGQRIADLLDRQLGEENIEYRSKRDSLRLGPVRLEPLPAGTWARWDRERLLRNGGALEQYKHPCLINDVNFRKTMPVEEQVAISFPA